MPMNDRTQKLREASRHDKPSRWRPELVAWLAFAGVLVINGVSVYWHHAQGQDWISALGLTPDRDLFRLIGDFAVPVMVTVLLLQTVRRLPPSQEKRILTWIGWSFFVFLFVWLIVGMMVFVPS